MTCALACATQALSPPAARADQAKTTRLALAGEPGAAHPVMVDVPERATDTPASAPSSTHASPWWVWAAVAAGVAGVAALVFTSSGKDPSCPGDRVCR
jgi:hypothetical protein